MSQVYDVHLYCTVRVKVTGIEAPSMEEAIALAEEGLPLEEIVERDLGWEHPMGATIEYVEADENIHHALVDVQGDEGYVQSQVFKNDTTRGWVRDTGPEATGEITMWQPSAEWCEKQGIPSFAVWASKEEGMLDQPCIPESAWVGYRDGDIEDPTFLRRLPMPPRDHNDSTNPPPAQG